MNAKFLFMGFLLFSFLHSQPPAPLESNEESETEDTITNAEARLELARVLSYMKRYEESLKEYQTLLQAEPNSPVVKSEMAKVLFYQGNTQEALNLVRQIPPEKMTEEAWLMIGDIYRKQKNYTDAEAIYARYIEKHPQEDKVRLKLAELLSWQKKYGDSVHHFRVILSHRPDDIQVRRKYAQVLTWMGDDDEAVREWKKTLQ